MAVGVYVDKVKDFVDALDGPWKYGPSFNSFDDFEGECTSLVDAGEIMRLARNAVLVYRSLDLFSGPVLEDHRLLREAVEDANALEALEGARAGSTVSELAVYFLSIADFDKECRSEQTWSAWRSSASDLQRVRDDIRTIRDGHEQETSLEIIPRKFLEQCPWVTMRTETAGNRKTDRKRDPLPLRPWEGGTIASSAKAFATTDWLKPRASSTYPPTTTVVSEAPSYAKAVRKSKQPAHKGWGDLSDEDDDFVDSLLVHCAKPGLSASYVEIPSDLHDMIPPLYRKVEKFCQAYDWQIRLSEVTMASQGYRCGAAWKDGVADVSFSDNISDADLRSAWTTLLTGVGLLGLRADYLSYRHNENEVAISYFCGILAKQKLSQGEPEYTKLCLKGGDGQTSVFRLRLQTLFATGSGASKLIFDALTKMYTRMCVDIEIDDDLKEFIMKHSFTSLEGMLQNCCHSETRRVSRPEKYTDRKGQVKTRMVDKLLAGKDVPELKITGLPFKQTESLALQAVAPGFNDRTGKVRRYLASLPEKERGELHAQAKACKKITDECYQRLAPLRRILRQRRQAIREIAKAKPGFTAMTQVAWNAAQIEYLAVCETLDRAIIDNFIDR